MREPAASHPCFAALARFEKPEHLVRSIRAARAAGYRRMDALSPFPVEGAAEALAFEDTRIAWLTLAGGLAGALTGYGVQIYANLAYPLDVGGRPLLAPQAFALVAVELAILFAVLFAIFGMLALNHLPRLHHPLFDAPGVERATCDRFFLVIFGDDPAFEPEGVRRFLTALEPECVDLLQGTEEPE